MFSDNKNLFDFEMCYDGIIVFSNPNERFSRIEILGTRELRNIEIKDKIYINEKYAYKSNGARINLFSENICVYVSGLPFAMRKQNILECHIELKKQHDGQYIMNVKI